MLASTTPSLTFFFLISAIGIATALIAGWISSAISDVPKENREYKDTPPPGFRCIWWPLQWVSFYLDQYLPTKTQEKLDIRLRQAGLEFSLKPSQFIAARLIYALFLGCSARYILSLFDIPDQSSFSPSLYFNVWIAGALTGWLYPLLWLHDQIQARRHELLKTLPFYLDILTLCVEAGLHFQGAMNHAVAKGPKGILREEFRRVLRDIRAGKSRADSLKSMSVRLNEPSISSLINTVIQAERMGMNLAPVLRIQADQRRSERFLRAEKLAMEAPVKMLFPLIAFIFPCTFIVLFFPIVMKFMNAGL